MSYQRYKLAEERKEIVHKAICNNPMSILETTKATGLALNQVAHIIDLLLETGLAKREKSWSASASRNVYKYEAIGEPYKAKTQTEIEEIYSKKMKSMSDVAHGKVLKKDTPTIPGARIVRNLDRPGSDYAWQRKNHKHTRVGIGSSFSLYDGMV